MSDVLYLSDGAIPDADGMTKLLTEGGEMMANLRIKKHDCHKNSYINDCFYLYLAISNHFYILIFYLVFPVHPIVSA